MEIVVCKNCAHRRSFHKKVDGNAWCSVQFCACKSFVETKTAPTRASIHQELDLFLDGIEKEYKP